MIRRFTDIVDDKTRAAGVLAFAVDTGEILLGLSKEGTYTTIGGYCAIGENSAETAVREFAEETLYNGPLMLLRGFVYGSPIKNFQYINFVGIIPEKFIPQIDNELNETSWVSMSELYGGILPLKPAFEDFIFESKPLIDYLMLNFGFLNE